MTLQLIQMQVDSEKEINNNGTITIQANLSLHCNLIGDSSTAYVILPLIVINANTQTGVQMDEQRSSEAQNYLASF